jgi:hypothetical protein
MTGTNMSEENLDNFVDNVTAILAAIALGVFICLSTGCALCPNTVTPEIVHESHITQHPPLAGRYAASL